MIEITELTKDYGKFRAVDRVSLRVEAGEIYGFLGPNGAGKTTTIRMLLGLLKPTTGSIVIGGHDLQQDPVSAKSIAGFVPDRPFLYDKLTGEEFLRFMGGLYGMNGQGLEERIPSMLSYYELAEWGNELIESYSHGMKQRLAMAGAMIHDPAVFIVDEPLVGLDPRGARQLKDTFRAMARGGKCIFMSTHILEIAEQMCDRIGIIEGGKIIAEGTVDQLRVLAEKDQAGLEEVFLSLTGGSDMQEVIESLRKVSDR